mmetsp:Transcript_111576/g.315580  ORF Transcript_111576/g.315580 Transcript_111576/m.315580 type:complete len:249 (-) Transcript_111576:163-909(-)
MPHAARVAEPPAGRLLPEDALPPHRPALAPLLRRLHERRGAPGAAGAAGPAAALGPALAARQVPARPQAAPPQGRRAPGHRPEAAAAAGAGVPLQGRGAGGLRGHVQRLPARDPDLPAGAARVPPGAQQRHLQRAPLLPLEDDRRGAPGLRAVAPHPGPLLHDHVPEWRLLVFALDDCPAVRVLRLRGAGDQLRSAAASRDGRRGTAGICATDALLRGFHPCESHAGIPAVDAVRQLPAVRHQSPWHC